MKKNIIKKKLFPSYEELYQEYINNSIDNLKKFIDISLTAKLLHYLDKPTFYYYCTVYKNTNSNPYNKNILFGIEFIDNEIPYITILNDFIKPSLNDSRNYYKCLTKEKFKFSLDNFKDLEKILESMIQGIKNFLYLIKESESIKAFIYFGEYKLNHIYQINDFFKSKNILNFYRIDEIMENNERNEKYIIFTTLYFLLFEPLENDKALVRLLFHQKLKDMDLSFEKNINNNSLILHLSSEIIKDDIEFVLIDRTRIIERKKKKIIKIDKKIDKFYDKNRIEKIDKLDKKVIGKIENDKNIDITDKNEKMSKNVSTIKNEINVKKEEKLNYSILFKDWFIYLDNIDFKQYQLVINNYKLFFNECKKYLKVNSVDNSLIREYNEVINFYEKVIIFYEMKNDKNNNERIKVLSSNIIVICSELINYDKNKKDNEYLLKIQKYLKYYK